MTARFTVDTQLFRELGELLVGRESTALVELIKNAYDADARAVIVTGENIGDPRKGRIVVEDNGVGMTTAEFRDGFLRIATRVKSIGSKRSPVFERRYTGEKGIGRLALHKLARHVEIRSYKWNGNPPEGPNLESKPTGIVARIDWDQIERKKSLEDVARSRAVLLSSRRPSAKETRQAGTRIILTRLRKVWTEADINRFHEDVSTLVPPKVLTEPLPENVLRESLLFSRPKVRDVETLGNDAFELQLAGDFVFTESLQASSAAAANWILEIDSDAKKHLTYYKIVPTAKTLVTYPHAESLSFEVPLQNDLSQVSFHARILQQSDRTWPTRFKGVRVFMEGFRVLPYGEPSDDWLNLAYDYTMRAGRALLSNLGEDFDDILAGEKGESTVQQPNQAYFGGAFLTHTGAPQLRMLVNREGFLPGPAVETIRRRIRLGIDMLTRLRYSSTIVMKQARRQERVAQRAATDTADARESPTAWRATEDLKHANEGLRTARAALAAGNVATASEVLERIEVPMRRVGQATQEIAAEAGMLRVLASVGTELAAFTHEINGLLQMAVGLTRQLEKIRSGVGLSHEARRQLREAGHTAQELRQSLERQAVYLVDITSIDARRRRSRQLVSDRFAAATRLVLGAATKRQIEIINAVPGELRTLPIFPAELTAVFANLLTNAVKFAGQGGRIKATAADDADGLRIRVENTGKAVDLRDADKWFAPFRSTTADVDTTLGQGMGLGLTITRSILDEYGAEIRFVAPSRGFSTALEIHFPEK